MAEHDPRQDAPFSHEGNRSLWIGWGTEGLAVVLGYWIGGTFLPCFAACFFVVLIVRGLKPKWFAKHIDAKIIEGTPYQRKISYGAWVTALMVCLAVSSLTTWARATFIPEAPSLAEVIAEKVANKLKHWAEAREVSATPAAPNTGKTIQKTPLAPKGSPLIVEDIVGIALPFNLSEGSPLAPQRIDPNGSKDPKYMAYGELESLAVSLAPSIKSGEQYTEKDVYRPPAGGESDYLSELLQAYLFKTIDSFQMDSTGVEWRIKEGVKPVVRLAIQPPDAELYPKQKISLALSTNRFFSTNYEKAVVKVRPFSVPKGSTFVLTDDTKNGTRGLRFERAGRYSLDYSVKAGLGFTGLPVGFISAIPNESALRTYSFSLIMRMTLEQDLLADTILAERYQKWAKDLLEAFRTSLESRQ